MVDLVYSFGSLSFHPPQKGQKPPPNGQAAREWCSLNGYHRGLAYFSHSIHCAALPRNSPTKGSAAGPGYET